MYNGLRCRIACHKSTTALVRLLIDKLPLGYGRCKKIRYPGILPFHHSPRYYSQEYVPEEPKVKLAIPASPTKLLAVKAWLPVDFHYPVFDLPSSYLSKRSLPVMSQRAEGLTVSRVPSGPLRSFRVCGGLGAVRTSGGSSRNHGSKL